MTPAPTGPLIEQSGSLDPTDPSDARGRYDRYFVQVGADDRIIVMLTGGDRFDSYGAWRNSRAWKSSSIGSSAATCSGA